MPMWLLQLVVIAWLPGAVIYRLPIGDRDKRAALDAEERFFWAVIISVALSTSIVLALAAAHRYSFERLLAADLIVTVLLAAASKVRLRLGAAARRPGLTALVPVALVILGLWRFFPTSENVMGGRDPGVYMNEGIQIAQRGTLVFDDPVVASVPAFARPIFFPPFGQTWLYSLRFMGFHIRNGETGAVVGQFPHFFPASIAIGHGLDGLTGARRVVGVWAILGLLAVYFAGARLIGKTAAFAAAALLGLHVIQVWFARYPNTEVVMQALLFAALLANARAHVDDDVFFAPVAGTLLGLLLFVRFDAVLAIVAVLAAIALGVMAGGRLRISFLAPLAVLCGLAAWYLLGPMRVYAELPILFLSNLKIWQYAGLALAAALCLAAIFIGSKIPRLSAAVTSAVPTVVTLVVLAGAIYALYVRQPVPGVLAERDAYALRTFTSFYLTVAGLLGGLLGFALVARRAFWRAPDLFLTLVVFSFFFFYKIRIVSDHFWMTRRFLPVVLPGALLFASAAALSGNRGGIWGARTVRSAIGIAFVVLLGMHYARAAGPILSHVEYAGLIPRLEKLASQVGDRDLLIVESRNASDNHVLALPLADIYARNVLLLASERPDKGALAAFLEWARTKYDRVLFLGGGGTDLLSPDWTARPLVSDRFQVPEYDRPVDAYPRFANQKEFDYSIYELAPPDPEAAGAPFDLDVGVNDDLYVVRFYAKETTEGRTFRWSKARAFISITNVRPTSRAVVLWMSDGGRPKAVPPADVSITLDGEPLGTVRVDTGFKPYTLAIPPALAGRLGAANRAVELTLTTSVWIPEQVLGTPDDRELGVMVERVLVQ